MQPSLLQRIVLAYLLLGCLLLGREEFAFWLDPSFRVLPDTWFARHTPLFLAVGHFLVIAALVPLVIGRRIPWARCWPWRRRRKPLLRLVK